MEINLVNKNSCRVCLNTKCTDTISFLGNQVLLSLYQFCIDVVEKLQVDLNGLPLSLCNNCVRDVENFAKFKQKCKESEEFWQSLHASEKKSENNDDIILCEVNKKKAYADCTEFDTLKSSEDIEKCNEVSQPYVAIENGNITESEIQRVYNTKDLCRSKIKKLRNAKASFKIHKCIKCNKEYRKYKWLKHHRKSCLSEKEKKCKNVIQQKSEEKATDYDCGLCDVSCHLQISLRDHLNEHWSNNDLKCNLCDYAGRDFADMITHRVYKCEDFYVPYYSLNCGVIHCNTLDLCPYPPTKLHSHLPNAAITCHICEQRMVALKSLQFHFRSVHLHKPGGLCSYCNKVFTTCKTWKRHERIHTENRLFICDLCERKFLYKYQIEAHLIDHSEVRHFVCETCGKAFKRMSALKGHIENVHEPNVPVVCEHCNRTYKNRDKLDLHLKKLNEYKPHECSVCFKRYLLESELKNHMFWHTDERPHVCEICGSKYKAKGQLKVHMLNHTGERPHKCSICCKGFGTTSQVKRHMSVHTGMRPHKCLHCKRDFHGLKALLEHSLQHKGAEAKTES